MSGIIDEFVALVKWKVDATELNAMTKNAREIGSSLQQVGSSIQSAAVPLLAVTAALVGVGIAAVSSAADLEMMQSNFEVMLGSAEAAIKMVADLRKMGAATPYETKDLAQATKTLLGFGMVQEKVLPVMSQLGDIAMGNRDKFQSLAMSLGKISASGKLAGDDLNMMIDAGFNPLQTISKETGRSMADLRKEMEKGGISTEMVMRAIKSETSKGGRFFDGMIKASQTLSGKISTLKDDMNTMLSTLGGVVLDSVKGLVDKLDAVVKGISKAVVFFSKLPKPIKDATVFLALFVAALGPILFFLGMVLNFVGGIAMGIAAIAPFMPVILAGAAAVAAVFAEIIIPVLLVVAAVALLVDIFAILKDDFDTWAKGGKSALGGMWKWFASMKDAVLAFTGPFRYVFGVLMTAAARYSEYFFAGWRTGFGLILAAVRLFWGFAGPIFMKMLPGVLNVLNQAFWGIGSIIGVLTYLVGGFFAIFAKGLDVVMSMIDKVWNSLPMKFIRGSIGAAANFGYSGNYQEYKPAYAGAAATATGAQYDNSKRSAQNNFNVGGVTVQVPGTNATPGQITTATRDGLADTFAMVRKQNGWQ